MGDEFTVSAVFSQLTAGEGETGLGPVASNRVLSRGDPAAPEWGGNSVEVILDSPGRVGKSLKELQAQLKPLIALFRIFWGKTRLD